MTVAHASLHSVEDDRRDGFFRLMDRAFALRIASHALVKEAMSPSLYTQPTNRVFKPRMDIFDSPDSPNITAALELPGIKKPDVAIHLQDHCLIVSGERRAPHNAVSAARHDSDGSQNRATSVVPAPTTSKRSQSPSPPPADSFAAPVREFKYGRFRRVIPLGPGVKSSDISASMDDGILTITWRRPTEDEAQRIKVE